MVEFKSKGRRVRWKLRNEQRLEEWNKKNLRKEGSVKQGKVDVDEMEEEIRKKGKMTKKGREG